MPRVQLPDGTGVNFPDGTDPGTMNKALSEYWAKKSGPTVAGAGDAGTPTPARPAANMKPAGGLVDKLASVANEVGANNPASGPGHTDEVLRPIGNIGRRTIRDLGSMPQATVEGVKRLATTPITAMQPQPDIIDSVRRSYSEGGVEQVGTDLAGDALTAALLHTSREPAANVLNSAGRGLKKTGALASRVGIGAPSPADSLGADAGRALSSNRVVAVTPSSLKAKVGALVEPAAQARDSILARSTAPPTDISTAVAEPFDTLTRKVTNAKTGAANPSAVRKLSTTKRAITQVQDPTTGEPSHIAKDPNLSPLEMSQLQRNLYNMTDYSTPDADYANQGVKGAASNLRESIVKAAPESTTMTDSLHDIMGANDLVKTRTNGPIPTSKTGLVESIARGAKMGIGTGTGALLDKLGSGMMDLGGAVRPSPVAPVRPQPTQPQPQGQLPGQTLQPPTPGATVTPPPTPVRGQLPASAGPSASPVAPAPPYPELNEAGARNRTVPSQPQGEVIPPRRRLVVTPEGVRAEGLPLESSTGRRAPSAMASRPSLIQRLMGSATPAAEPVAAPTPSRLPAPTDIDGWEALVDQGMAKYNTASHSYDYTGPIKSSKRGK